MIQSIITDLHSDANNQEDDRLHHSQRHLLDNNLRERIIIEKW